MFLRDLMLAFSRRTVHYRDMVRLGPGPQTPAEAPRHTHQVVVVQILIGTVERTPPNAKASSRLPHGKIGVAHHPIHAIITTFQKLAIKLNWSGMVPLSVSQTDSILRSVIRTRTPPQLLPQELPRRGHFFGAQSPKKPSTLPRDWPPCARLSRSEERRVGKECRS